MGLFDRFSKKKVPTVGPANPVRFEFGAEVCVNSVSAGYAHVVSLVKSARVKLVKAGMAGAVSQVVLLLDNSGSMYSDYARGHTQELVERALAFGLTVDLDGKTPILAFANDLKKSEVTEDNYRDHVLSAFGAPIGSTNLAAALTELTKMASTTKEPIFAILVTDGNPDQQASCTALFKELARYPVFIKALIVRTAPYIEQMGRMEYTLVKNIDVQKVDNLADVYPDQFYEIITAGWCQWVASAKSTGVLL